MVDLSKHLARAKQGLDRNNFEYAFEVLSECIDVDPANLDVHRMVLDVAKRKAKMETKRSLFGTMSMPTMSKDPHKLFAATVKRLEKIADHKAIIECGESARRMFESGVKPMLDVALLYYEDARGSGLFNEKVLWHIGGLRFQRYLAGGKKQKPELDAAIKAMSELEKAMPNHPEAGKLVKNWHAEMSILLRNEAGGSSGDYRSQLTDDLKARDAELLNRMPRTREDAAAQLQVLERRLSESPGDKALWLKAGDLCARFRAEEPAWVEHARRAYRKAQELDEHDFVIVMRLGQLEIDVLSDAVRAAEAGGGDVAAAERALLQAQVVEFRRRVERQPTDMTHRFNLGSALFKLGEIGPAAAEFQKTVNDPRLRASSQIYLGQCFARKNLLDLASQQYDAYLSNVLDDSTDEAKQVRYERALIYERMARKQEAIADYNRLVVIDLGYRDAAERLSALQNHQQS